MTAASKFFLDSNIWIYALSNDNDEKAVKARNLVERLDDNIYFTSQVANETCLILKKKSAMPESQIRSLISSFFANYRYVEMSDRYLLQLRRCVKIIHFLIGIACLRRPQCP